MPYVCFTCSDHEGTPMIVSDAGYDKHEKHEISPPGNFSKCDSCGFYSDGMFAGDSCTEDNCDGILQHLT